MNDSAQPLAKPCAAEEWSASTRWHLLGLAVGQVVLMPLAEWLSWRNSFVHHVGSILSLMLSFVLIGGILAFPMALVGLCFSHHRRNALWLLLCALAAIPCCIFGLTLSQPIRQEALGQVMVRAESLIAAIQKFEAATGKPPPNLRALVPNYLAALPTPGIGTSEEFSYLLSGKRSDMGDNPWMLEVIPPNVGISFDVFIYLPKQNYPREGWGGVLERIGTWAYVHE